MYEKLLSDYRCLSSMEQYSGLVINDIPKQISVSEPQKTKSTTKRLSNLMSRIQENDNDDDSSDDDNDNDNDSSDDENDLVKQTLDLINNDDDDVKLEIQPRSSKTVEIAREKSLDLKHDALIEELENLDKTDQTNKNIPELGPDKLRNDIKAGMKTEGKEFERIEKKKYNARAGIEAHEARQAKIWAREKELIAQGLSHEEARKRTREELYPEAIPSNERLGDPKINVFVEDGYGRLRQKQMNLLAWNENDFEDDNPELTKHIEETQGKHHTDFQETVSDRSQNMPNMDLPVIDEEKPSNNETNDQSLDDKIKQLLQDDQDDDVVSEEVLNKTD